MSDEDVRLNKLLCRIADDIFATGYIETMMTKDDWYNEIKPAMNEVFKKTFGSIHSNILPYIKHQEMIDRYEASGLIF